MRLEARQITGFLRKPEPQRIVLLHGEDEGLIRERAAQLTRCVAGALDDPFRVIELDRDAWSDLVAETASLSLTGGRRVIRVRDAGDAITDVIKKAAKTPGDSLIVLEAPSLGKGRLRTFIDGSSDAVSIACYPEDARAVQDLIRSILSEAGAAIDPEALGWVAGAVGGDRSRVRGEAEKLALLAGAGGRIDIQTARECCGDAAGASVDEALVAATKGDVVAADIALERALAEGVSFVALIRQAIGHLMRLQQARLHMAGGLPPAEAVRAMRPPVFFRLASGMEASLVLWSEARLLTALEEARRVEIKCKLTGSRPELLTARFVGGLARQARLMRQAS